MPGEAQALIRTELLDLGAAITAAMGKADDRETKAHLKDSQDQIARILDRDKSK